MDTLSPFYTYPWNKGGKTVSVQRRSGRTSCYPVLSLYMFIFSLT